MNLATKAIYFCYCPGEKKDFYLSLKDFLSYLLSKIDHTDNNSIVLAYSLQQQTLSENYTFDDIINILNKPVFHHTSETEHSPPAFASDNNLYRYLIRPLLPSRHILPPPRIMNRMHYSFHPSIRISAAIPLVSR